MELIDEITTWKLGNLHILATSRPEPDIEDMLVELCVSKACIQSVLVNGDIQIHLRERLQNDTKLKKWPRAVQKEMEDALMEGSHGM